MEVKQIHENDKINIKRQETKHSKENPKTKTETPLKHISSDVSIKSVNTTNLAEFDYDLCNGVNYII